MADFQGHKFEQGTGGMACLGPYCQKPHLDDTMEVWALESSEGCSFTCLVIDNGYQLGHKLRLSAKSPPISGLSCDPGFLKTW